MKSLPLVLKVFLWTFISSAVVLEMVPVGIFSLGEGWGFHDKFSALMNETQAGFLFVSIM